MKRAFAVAVGVFVLAVLSPWAEGVVITYFHEQVTRGLYDFNTETGNSRFRAPVAWSPRLFSMDRRESDGVVIASESSDFNANALYALDPLTGDLTTIGRPQERRIYTSISFHESSGALYGMTFEFDGRRALVIIDSTDASFTEVGELPFGGTGSSALEFMPDGTLLAEFNWTLYSVDPSNGSGAAIGRIAETPRGSFGDFANVGSELYGTTFGGEMWRIDPTTAQGTPIGTLVNDRAIGGAFVIPEPGIAFLVLSAPLVLLRRMRRRE